MSYQEIRDGFVNFLADQQYTHAVTLKPNGDRVNSKDALHRLFTVTHMLVQRRLLGPRFHLKKSKQTPALAFVEGCLATGHLHTAFKVPLEHNVKFESAFADDDRSGLWRKLVPSGTCVVERIYDAHGWLSYSAKNIWQIDDFDRVMILPLLA